MKRRVIQPRTPSDEQRLRKLAAEGRGSVTIAERMKRTPDSIRNRAKKLEIVLVKSKAAFAKTAGPNPRTGTSGNHRH